MKSYVHRLPESHKAASKRIAAADDTTMDQFFVVAIAEKISAMETADFFKRCSAQSTQARADKVWANVSTRAPALSDQWVKGPSRKK